MARNTGGFKGLGPNAFGLLDESPFPMDLEADTLIGVGNNCDGCGEFIERELTLEFLTEHGLLCGPDGMVCARRL
jgi:hypothetical protein